MEFRIYRNSGVQAYSKDEGKFFSSPYTGYCLVDNKPEFFGEGNFCGYYAKSGFADGHVIAETNISWTEDEETVTFYRAIILDCDYIRDIDDTYRSPLKFNADSIDEARQVFKKVVSEDLFDKLNP